VSIAEALYYMMSVSDNVSAVMLQDASAPATSTAP
jgi:hypothetical protein